MKKFLFLFFLLTGVTLTSHSQAVFTSIDSLIDIADYAGAEALILRSPSSINSENYRLKNIHAEIQITQGKLEQAETLLRELESDTRISDPFLKAITKTNLGSLNLNKARNDLALENLQEALTLFQQSGNANSIAAAKCLATMSSLYLSTGKVNQAEANGLIALQIRENIKGEASEAVAASYNDLGLVYSQSDPDKALEYYEKALAVYQKLHQHDHPKIAIANTNLGFVYRQLKLYGDAVTDFENAEAVWKKVYPQGHPNQALAMVNLGMTYGQMGNTAASLGYFEKAIAMYKQFYGEKHPALSFVYNQIGVIQLGNSLFDEALSNFQRAINSNSPVFASSNIAQNPRATEYYNGKVMLYSLRLKAQAFEGKYLGKSLKFNDLQLALSCLYSCDSLIDDIRYHSADENDKIELGATANEVYEDGVRISQAMSEITIKPYRYREIAFYFAEKSKSAVLQESIADAEAKSFAGIPSELLDEEKTLKATIAMLSQKLSQKPGEEEEKRLRQDLFATNRTYEAFTHRLEKEYPDYYNLKFNRATPSIEELQKILDSRTGIVGYFVAEKNQRLYSFIITNRKFKIYNSTLPVGFDKMIKGFNNSLFYSVHESYKTFSNILSPVLLRGIPSSLENIVIIPASRLGTMPFDALSLKKIKGNVDFPNISFLVNKASVSYEFSAGILLQKTRSVRKSQNGSIFLCAPITFPERDHLNDLPGTDLEVNNIANLFASNSLVVKGMDANEGLMKSGKLEEFRFLHFATHGIVDEQSPELSRIYLQANTNEDGNLFSGELFNLRLNADLAVLSACQTGLGKLSKGEGVIGLSRALVYAGARKIIVSYWSVADESTSSLMTDFYKQLVNQGSMNFSGALQRAKKNMIASQKYAAPYYWAPFVLIGY